MPPPDVTGDVAPRAAAGTLRAIVHVAARRTPRLAIDHAPRISEPASPRRLVFTRRAPPPGAPATAHAIASGVRAMLHVKTGPVAERKFYPPATPHPARTPCTLGFPDALIKRLPA